MAVVNGDFKAAAATADRENDGERFYRGHGGGDHEDGGSGDPSGRGGARTSGFLMSWVLGRPTAVGTLDGRGQVMDLR